MEIYSKPLTEKFPLIWVTFFPLNIDKKSVKDGGKSALNKDLNNIQISALKGDPNEHNQKLVKINNTSK